MQMEEESALRDIMVISALIFIVMVMLLFAVITSPPLTPVAPMADRENDGHGNDEDAFPRDGNEWRDDDGETPDCLQAYSAMTFYRLTRPSFA